MDKPPRTRARTSRTIHPRHVLIADDGSQGAARAREFALMLADAAGARLTAVYVREPLDSPADGRKKIADTIAAAAARGRRCRIIVERPVGITNAGRRVLSAAQRCGADAIVVGARGSGIVRKLLGSVSSYVVTHARVSVVVVR